ncbi:MAG: ABC transporter permease [Candidatus Brocadiia bacterium]
MGLPVSYSLRNLTRRPIRSLMTVSGIAIVVFACVIMLGLTRGIMVRMDVSGEESNILAINRKGQNILFSNIEPNEVEYLSQLEGVATGPDGSALVSPELMHVPYISAEVSGKKMRSPISIRGVGPKAYAVHKSVKLIEGRLPENEHEMIAGVNAHLRMSMPKEALAVGKKVNFEAADWTIVGRFEAGGSVVESEIWCLEADLHTVLRRRTHSFVVVKMNSPEAVQAALPVFSSTGALQKYFKAWSEKAYYFEVGGSLKWVFWLSIVMVIAIAVAGALIGLNTMYTAIINRVAEIATLRVLAFSRTSIFMSLALESVAMALIGGAVGLAAGFLLNSLPFKMSQGTFFLIVDSYVISAAIGLSLIIGVVGVLFPALRGLQMSIVEGLSSE